MRTAFINELTACARSNRRVFLLVGDLGYSVVDAFANEFPDRFLNVGVCEQNMMGVAAGLASEGYHVIAYSIANFSTFRCAEQIRNDVGYHGLPVTIVAVGGGLAYGNLGYSHHAVQDFSLMRSIPSLLIAAPGDPTETVASVRYLLDHPSPSYLRLGKAGEPVVSPPTTFVKPAPRSHVGDHAPCALLTTGGVLKLALDLAADPRLASAWGVYSMPLWGGGQGSGLVELVQRKRQIVVLEEHLLAGGFGSYVREVLNEHGDLQSRVTVAALSDVTCDHVGTQGYLRDLGGLQPERLAQRLLSLPAHS